MFGSGIKTILKTTLASTLMAATMFGASAPLANAASGMNAPINLVFSGEENFKIQKVHHRHGRRHGGYGHGRRHGPRHGGYRGHRPRPGGYGGHGHCSPRHAVNKAWNMGLNRPHVKRVGKHRIVVKGGYHGSRAKIVFSRRGGCRVLDFQRHYW